MLEMGGYGSFVWSSYGMVFAGLIWLTINGILKAKRIRKQVIESQL